MWVLYDHTTDHPDHFVARKWVCEKPTDDVILGATLNDVRRAIPLGFARMDRMPGDDSKIGEVWL